MEFVRYFKVDGLAFPIPLVASQCIRMENARPDQRINA